MDIQRITIGGLFGKYDADFQIHDNTLILVGANGLGKSTILSIAHYALTRQWDLLQSLPFQYVNIRIDDQDLHLNTDHLRQTQLFSQASANIGPRSAQRQRAAAQLVLTLSPATLEILTKTEDTNKFASIYKSLPKGADLEQIYEAWTFVSSPQNKELVQAVLEPGPLKEALTILARFDKYRIMYLPTYRRIEKTLQDIFPDIDEAIHRYQRTRSNLRSRSPAFEFVQFGMEDVRELFEQKLSQLRSHSNRVLSSTSGSYLRDVVRGQGSDYDEQQICALQEETVLKALHRYKGEFTETDVHTLLEVPSRVRQGHELSFVQKLMAHYLIKLIEAMENISTVEKPLRAFAQITSEYFYDKKITYDDIEGSLTISNIDDETEIDLKDLSSGEKQIVSLLSHVYLEEKESLLFIDEPELSLSVGWQTRLLPDLRSSGRCAFLLAVTHSPFIFDNELSEYAIDVRSSIGRTA